ncbi:hypothetical protein L484_017145 [Morus notabilis]|uniref:Copia protein n=1 Tax=Morus notabilis TaxID=981085 RepID=W9QKW4_9ROSA|nr:hypothetical protein L484_017145 [Morus notabilis]
MEDIGFLNTRLWRKDCSRSKNSSYYPNRPPACEATKEATWLRKFLTDLEVVPYMDKPIKLYCDNSGAVANLKKPKSHKNAKHIERKCHLIRDIVDRGDVAVLQIASENNLVNPFMKTLPLNEFNRHLEGFGIRDMTHLF